MLSMKERARIKNDPEDSGVDSCMRVSMEATGRGEGNCVLLRARYVQVPHSQPGRDNQLAL